MYFEDQEYYDFYYENCLEKKQFDNFKTFNGQTYRKIRLVDRKILEKDFVFSIYISNLKAFSPKILALFDEENLFVLPVQEFVEKNSHFVNFSLNKQKRWLLPEYIKEKTILYNYENSNDYSSKKNRFGLVSTTFNRYCKWHGNSIVDYQDNKARTLNKSLRINFRSVVKTYLTETKNKATVYNFGKNQLKLKKRSFKYGNRDRNSGIKRKNQTFKINEENNDTTENDFFENQIFYSFWSNSKPNILQNYNLKNQSLFRKYFNSFKTFQGKNRYYGSGRKFKKAQQRNKKRLTNLFLEKEINIEKNDYYNSLRKYNLQYSIKRKKQKSKFKPKLKLRKEEKALPSKKYENIPEINENKEQAKFYHSELMSKYNLKIISIYFINQKEFIDSINDLINKNKEISKVTSINQDIYPCFIQIDLIEYLNLEQSLNINYKEISKKSSQSLIFFKWPLDETQKKSFNIYINTDCLLDLDMNFDNLEFSSIIQFLNLVTKKLVNSFDRRCNENNKQLNSVETSTKDYIIGTYSFNDFETICENFKSSLLKNKYVISNKINNQNFNEACEICFEKFPNKNENVDIINFILKLNHCSHYVCYSCLSVYIKYSILNFKVTQKSSNSESDKISEIQCPFEKCNFVFSLEFLSFFVNINLIEKYIKFYSEMKILRKKDYVQCRNINCKKFINIEKFRNDLNVSTLLCECGSAICKYCLKDAHFPALCSQNENYLKLIEKNRAYLANNENFYKSQGKYCPNCKNYMEKNGGCIFIKCICGILFCWKYVILI